MNRNLLFFTVFLITISYMPCAAQQSIPNTNADQKVKSTVEPADLQNAMENAMVSACEQKLLEKNRLIQKYEMLESIQESNIDIDDLDQAQSAMVSKYKEAAEQQRRLTEKALASEKALAVKVAALEKELQQYKNH